MIRTKTDEAARTAVRVGRNAIVDSSGRPIRCEPAKVNRTLAISRHDGSMFSEDEVQQDLDGFGGTESLEFSTSMNSQPVRGLKEGHRCFVRFIYRQDAVDCYQVSNTLEAQYFVTDGRCSSSVFMIVGLQNGRITFRLLKMFLVSGQFRRILCRFL